MTKKFYGQYRGIVVQNNDPEHAGKLKIFVPSVPPSVYDQWYALSPTDKKFKFLGLNLNSDLGPILSTLKKVLPWASPAGPIIGSTSIGRYNEEQDTGSISDANNFNLTIPTNSPTTAANDFAQNRDGIGEKPGNIYELEEFKLKDKFFRSESNDVISNNINPFGANYKPAVYSNKPKGSFGVPDVGSHVWVFFEEGNPNAPVYWGAAFGKTEWSEIFSDDVDYPNKFENNAAQTEADEAATEIYRNKYVLNQKGATIEIINTDKRERIKISQYSGSFIELNSHVTTLLSVKNKQELIQGDSYLTINGTENVYTEKDSDRIIKGNNYKKIGNQNVEVMSQYYSLLKNISDYKQLFDIKRASKLIEHNICYTSELQSMAGTFAMNPAKITTKTVVNNIYPPGGIIAPVENMFAVPSTVSKMGGDMVLQGSILTGQMVTAMPTTPTSPPIMSLSTQDGYWEKETQKVKIDELHSTYVSKFLDLETQLGEGGNEINLITKNRKDVIGLYMNDLPSFRVDNIGKSTKYAVKIDPTCSYVDIVGTALVEYVHVDSLPGGTWEVDAYNGIKMVVGSKGVSIKTSGPVDLGGTITNVAGVQLNLSSKFETNLISNGRTNIEGEVVTLKQKDHKQILVDSSLGVTDNAIIGGSTYTEGESFVQHLTGPVEIHQTEDVVVFGRPYELTPGAPVGGTIGKKLGSAYLRIVWAPDNDTQGQQESKEESWSKITSLTDATGPEWTSLASRNKNVQVVKLTLYADAADEDSIITYPHSHLFKNLPMTLMTSNAAVREKAASLNDSTSPGSASSQNHGYHDITT